MTVLCTQNLFGIVEFDDYGVSNTVRLDVLSNGIATDGQRTYVGDWSDIIVLKDGAVEGKIRVDGYDNIHTVNVYRNELLVSSTGNDRVLLGKDVIFDPRDYGFKQFTYVNAAIPYTEREILIGMRNLKLMLIFDVDERKIKGHTVLPYLNNMHHPTPYADGLFLVSDGDRVVLFDINGNMLLASPQMNWPRGIKVVDQRNVYVVDRSNLYLWNPLQNRIVRKWNGPYTVFREKMVNNDVVVAGAFFDLIVK